MKVVCFGASTSKNSINKQLASYVGSLLEGADIDLLDLNDFEAPLYSIDREAENGIPEIILQFKQKIKDSSGVIISFAEHNGAYTAAFKNIMDWTSRIEGKLWEDKPYLLLATSPGGRGGINVLNLASNTFPHMGAQVVGQFSLPSFKQNFSEEDGIKDAELKIKFELELSNFKTAIVDQG